MRGISGMAEPREPEFRIQPCNLEAEQTVLGSLMVAGKGWDKVKVLITAEDFYEPVHQRIFEALSEAHARGQIADWRIVAHLFEADPALAELGRADYLRKLATAAEPVVNVEQFARVVADLGVKRRVIAGLDELRAKAFNGVQVSEVVSSVRALADTMALQSGRTERVRALFSDQWPSVSKPRLIDGLMGHDFFGMIYGQSYAGKSFLAIDIGLSIALGRRWRGRDTDKGLVIYVAAEGPTSVQRRAQAWMKRYGDGYAAVPAFAVIPGPVDILHPERDALAIVNAARKAAERCGLPVRLVIVDTLAAASPGTKEDSEDFGKAIHNLKVIGDDLKCALLVVHHSGKDAGKGARGHSSLEAALDINIEVTEESGTREARIPVVRKLRDGREPVLWPYVIEDQVIGYDEDGQAISAGVAVTVEPAEPEDNPGLMAERCKIAQKLQAEGLSQREIGRKLGVSRNMVVKYLRVGERK